MVRRWNRKSSKLNHTHGCFCTKVFRDQKDKEVHNIRLEYCHDNHSNKGKGRKTEKSKADEDLARAHLNKAMQDT